jgi:hypothetical protein
MSLNDQTQRYFNFFSDESHEISEKLINLIYHKRGKYTLLHDDAHIQKINDFIRTTCDTDSIELASHYLEKERDTMNSVKNIIDEYKQRYLVSLRGLEILQSDGVKGILRMCKLPSLPNSPRATS